MVTLLPILLSSFLTGQAPAAEPPLRNRPANFSYVVGLLRIRSEAAPTTIEVEKPITLTVRIEGDTDGKHVPQRRFLKVFPEDFSDHFFVEDVPELDRVLAAEKAWEFIYRLRPKSTQVKIIPSLKLVYYHPARNQYATARAEPIALIVQAAAPSEAIQPPIKVILAPETFFEVASAEDILRWGRSSAPGLKSLVGLLLLAVASVVILGQFVRPPPELERWVWRSWVWRKKRLTYLVLDGLSSRRPEKIRASVIDHVRHRLHLGEGEWTGAELVQRLRRSGCERPLLDQFQALFSRCDEVRFSASNSATSEALAEQLGDEAGRLILSLESDPCVSRLA